MNLIERWMKLQSDGYWEHEHMLVLTSQDGPDWEVLIDTEYTIGSSFYRVSFTDSTQNFGIGFNEPDPARIRLNVPYGLLEHAGALLLRASALGIESYLTELRVIATGVGRSSSVEQWFAFREFLDERLGNSRLFDTLSRLQVPLVRPDLFSDEFLERRHAEDAAAIEKALETLQEDIDAHVQHARATRGEIAHLIAPYVSIP